jgi:hypothetical protein
VAGRLMEGDRRAPGPNMLVPGSCDFL